MSLITKNKLLPFMTTGIPYITTENRIITSVAITKIAIHNLMKFLILYYF